MVTVLRQLLGDDPGVQLQLTFFGVTRPVADLRRGRSNEVIEARIYSGIHFRTADDVGARLGRQVAHFVMTHALRPAERVVEELARCMLATELERVVIWRCP